MPTIRGLRVEAARRIAPLDADLLLGHVLGVSKEYLYSNPEAPLTPADGRKFEALVVRRARGEPVAYLRGFKEFFGLHLWVDPRVLIPRPESELLVSAALAGGDGLIAEVGTGSGAIAVALAVANPRLRVIATDISSDALMVARINAQTHDVLERIDFRHGDLLGPVGESVAAVVANLPYLTDAALTPEATMGTGLEFEPRLALAGGADGLSAIRRLLADLPRVLQPGGRAYLECDPVQVGLLVQEFGGTILRDLAGDDRVVIITR